MTDLKAGDLCEILNDPRIGMQDPHNRRFIGCECTFLRRIPPDQWGYDCEIHLPAAGRKYLAAENMLRKKKPPRKQRTTTWDKCVWQPKDLHVLSND